MCIRDRLSGDNLDDPTKVLHAGTASRDGVYVSNGGRVLNALGVGGTLAGAVETPYAQLEGVELQGAFYRKDIARAAIEGAISL